MLTVPDLGFTAGQDFRGLLAMADPALRNHRWGVFTFHGVGGEWLSVTSDALDELAGYLARHPEVWTATFGDVVRYIQESQALGVRPAGPLQFELSWPLDPQIFNLPLSLKWQLPDGWNAGQAFGDGKPLVLAARGRTMLFDVPPQTRSLRFEQK